MLNSSSKEYDDMDGYDWVNWIDEYHCTDYWNEDYIPEQDDFEDEP
jgi:hypothetical protein